MITGTAKLVVDLGNSETRVMTIFGKNTKGRPKKRLSVLDNRYSALPEDKLDIYTSGDTYTDENSKVFRQPNGALYCNGDLCNIEMLQTSFRPSALEKKYETLITRLALTNAIRQGIEDVAVISNCDMESIDVDWEMHLLLPPEDIDMGAKSLADMAKSISGIDFIIPKFKSSVRVTKVNVYPEGMCAFFGVIFEGKGIPRPEYRYLIDSNESTVIFDIGAGTTDIVMVKGSKVVQSSRFTKEIGGNNVHRIVQRTLRNKGVSLPEEVLREGVNTGYVKSGARVIDITKDIADAKRTVSSQLVDAVQEFFESSMISIRTIANILICGGGAEESSNSDIAPIANYVVEYMRRLSPDLQRIEMPTEVVDGEEVKVSPRLLNIKGAGVLAE